MTDLLGPGAAGCPRTLPSTDPSVVAALDFPDPGDSFFGDCVANTPGTGTPPNSEYTNRALQQLRRIIRLSGTPLSYEDDLLGVAIQSRASSWIGAFGGTANALTATLSPAPTILIAGLTVRGIMSTPNTGATTLNVNGIGNIAVNKLDGTPTLGGELIAGQEAEFTYTGSAWVITSGPTSSTFVPVVPTTTWYVDATNGTDAPGQGFTSGAGAFASIVYAVQTISKYFSSVPVTVNVAAGTYAGATIGPAGLISSWIIAGSGVSTCNLTSSISTVNLGRGLIVDTQTVTISGFKITSLLDGVVGNIDASVIITGCSFVGTGTSSVAMNSQNGSLVQVRGAIGISGSFGACFSVIDGGMSLAYSDPAQTFASTITFGATTATAVAVATSDGNIHCFPSALTFAGSTPTGPKYNCNDGGGINAGGGGTGLIPGSSAGTVTSPGWYSP